MPPPLRPRPAHPQTSRCRYVDDSGVRCRRVATVSGGFCRQCAVAIELELEDGGRADRLVGTLDRILARGIADPMLSQVGAFLGGILGARLVSRAPTELQDSLRTIGRQAAALAAERARASASHGPPRPQARQAPPPPAPPAPNPAAERAAALARAREVMGFEPAEPLTPEKIQDRKRGLAKVFHPDLGGGSKAQMQRVLAASLLLTSSLPKKTARTAARPTP